MRTILDSVLPDARDGGRKLLPVFFGDFVQDPVGLPRDLVKVRGRDRKLVFVAQMGEEPELNLMEQAPSRQRIELFDPNDLFPRLKSVDGVEEEAVGAGRKLLERRRRIAPGPWAV